MTANLMSLNDNKAGMKELDTERINSIIMEASKGSKFYANQQRKQQQLQTKIDAKLKKLEKLTGEMIKNGEIEAGKIIGDIVGKRDLSRHIIHIDMDAFYAAVEMRDNPSLRTKPMAVGGMSMLSTSNYLARRYGVRAAMPGFIAKKLCPDLVIVPNNSVKYTAVSHDVRQIMAEYDPNFAPMSLDEAYLDITEHIRRRSSIPDEDRTFGCEYTCDCEDITEDEKTIRVSENRDAVCKMCMGAFDSGTRVFGTTVYEACRELRWRIFNKTRLTASAGIASNTLIAKIASDKNKPNGQCEIGATEDNIALFIRQLPVRKIPGIGNVSEQILKAIGIKTCSDMYEKRGILYHLCTPCNFTYYLRIAVGEGESMLANDSERKSMSVERTFNEMSNATELLSKCRELSEALAEDLSEGGVKGKTVTLKIKLSSFEVRTRAQTLSKLTSDPEEICASASELLRAEINNSFPDRLKLRLMGVRVSGLVQNSMTSGSDQQLSLAQAFQASSNSNEKEREILPQRTETKSTKSRSSKRLQSTIEKSFKSKIDTECNSTDSEGISIPDHSTNTSNPADSTVPFMVATVSDEKSMLRNIATDYDPTHWQEMKNSTPENDVGDSAVSPCGSPVFDGNSQGQLSQETVEPAERNTLDGSSKWSGFQCPVCFNVQLVESESQFHAHLDFCLSRGAISEAIREADDECDKFPIKRRRIDGATKSNQSPQLRSNRSHHSSGVSLLKYFSKVKEK